MKSLKKIILPIITIGSVAGIATPLVIGCAKAETPIATNSDINYVPTIPKHTAATYPTEAAASNEYYTNVIQNPNIFIQDYFSHYAAYEKILKTELEEQYENVVYSFSYSFYSLKITLHDQEKGIYLLSLKTAETAHATYEETLVDNTKRYWEVNEKRTEETINLPISLEYVDVETRHGWQMSPAIHMTSFQDWYVKTVRDTETTRTRSSATSKQIDHSESISPGETLPAMWYVSHYFSDVTKG